MRLCRYTQSYTISMHHIVRRTYVCVLVKVDHCSFANVSSITVSFITISLLVRHAKPSMFNSVLFSGIHLQWNSPMFYTATVSHYVATYIVYVTM